MVIVAAFMLICSFATMGRRFGGPSVARGDCHTKLNCHNTLYANYLSICIPLCILCYMAGSNDYFVPEFTQQVPCSANYGSCRTFIHGSYHARIGIVRYRLSVPYILYTLCRDMSYM